MKGLAGATASHRPAHAAWIPLMPDTELQQQREEFEALEAIVGSENFCPFSEADLLSCQVRGSDKCCSRKSVSGASAVLSAIWCTQVIISGEEGQQIALYAQLPATYPSADPPAVRLLSDHLSDQSLVWATGELGRLFKPGHWQVSPTRTSCAAPRCCTCSPCPGIPSVQLPLAFSAEATHRLHCHTG